MQMAMSIISIMCMMIAMVFVGLWFGLRKWGEMEGLEDCRDCVRFSG
jgi:hypothetical protein